MNYKNNKYILKFKRFLYYIYGEKFFKQLDYNWSDYPSRSEIINKLIATKKYSSFLEIGCDKNVNFSNVSISRKVGVDPNSGGTHKMTSDEFFKINKEKFDLIFIDGLHVTSQVDRDIDNSLKCINKNGLILLHDCLPKKIWHQVVPCIYPKWNGDVWKAFVECRTKHNLDCYTCYADWGIGVIFKRQNSDILNIDQKNFKKLKFNFFFHNYKKLMNIIEFDDLIKKF